jgi:hypothetical protein
LRGGLPITRLLISVIVGPFPHPSADLVSSLEPYHVSGLPHSIHLCTTIDVLPGQCDHVISCPKQGLAVKLDCETLGLYRKAALSGEIACSWEKALLGPPMVDRTELRYRYIISYRHRRWKSSWVSESPQIWGHER